MGDKRGKLIVIEGNDSSGKETQTKRLIERLNSEGHLCEGMSFPQYETPTGRVIGQCYLGKTRKEWSGDSNWFGHADSLDPMVAFLFYAADRRFALPKINGILNSERHLIMDRYVPSNMAHQGGKVEPRERYKVVNSIERLEYDILELPRPNAVVFLYMPFEVAIELRKSREESADGHESNLNHLRGSEETYLWISSRYNWTRINCASDRTMKSLRTKEDIGEEVYSNVIKVINQKY